MVFVRLETGCYVCLTHRLNQDGYLRKRWLDRVTLSTVVEMFHRFIFRAHKGDIPEGFEVNHMCGVRACCNPEHLEALDGVEHTVLTNRTRYADREATAKEWINAQGRRVTGVEIGKLFGVTFSTGCRWLRELGLSRRKT